MKALVITGLANDMIVSDTHYIQESLQSKGYEVDTHIWRSGDINYNQDYAYVVAHSAGSGQAQIYAAHNPNTTVYILGTPLDTNLPNVVFVGQWYDPVAILGGVHNIDRMVGGRPHNKDDLYRAIEHEIPAAITPVTTSDEMRARRGNLRRGE